MAASCPVEVEADMVVDSEFLSELVVLLANIERYRQRPECQVQRQLLFITAEKFRQKHRWLIR